VPHYRGEASNLVAQALGLDDGDLFAHALVCVKVLGEAVVILLDDNLRAGDERRSSFRCVGCRSAVHALGKGSNNTVGATNTTHAPSLLYENVPERPFSRSSS